MSIYDQRRLLIAALLTMVALPTLWWAKRDNPISTPAVASADVGGALGAATGASGATAEATVEPGFLSGPGQATDIVPAEPSGPPAEDSFTRTGLGSFKTFLPDSLRLCQVPFLPGGTRITIENTDNGERIECLVERTRLPEGVVVVMDATLFVRLSDLAEAPIPVRIRW